MSNSATPWTVVHKPLMSMGFFRQEYWGTLPFLPPGDFLYHLRHQENPLFRIFLYSSLESVFFSLSNICIKYTSPAPPALVGRFFTTELPGNPFDAHNKIQTGKFSKYGANAGT